MDDNLYSLENTAWAALILIGGFALLRSYARRKLRSLYYHSYYNEVLTADKYKVKAKFED